MPPCQPLTTNNRETPAGSENAESSSEQSNVIVSDSVTNVVSPSNIPSDRVANSSDFQSPLTLASKRKREPSTQSSDSDDDEAICQCPVCFENWSNTGAHRIVSMKCGHLFGLRYSMICLYIGSKRAHEWISNPTGYVAA